VENSAIRGDIKISSSTFSSDLEIHECSLPLSIDISNTQIEEIICTTNRGLPTLFNFDGRSSIYAGNISPCRENSVYYDLSHSTLGDVSFENPDPHLENYLFKDTKYNGFDFYQVNNKLSRIGHKIHKFGYSGEEFNYTWLYDDMSPVVENSFESQTSFKNQVETYTRAKNCAKSTGINDSASSFFVNQKKAELKLNQARRTEDNISTRRKYKLWRSVQKIGSFGGLACTEKARCILCIYLSE